MYRLSFPHSKKIKLGFSLIELLVVIVILGIMTGFITTNLMGSRERASDSSKKRNLNQLKIALHLYNIDFGQFPSAAGNNGFNFYACGNDGVDRCDNSFSAGGKEYMGKIPKNSGGQNDFRYYPCSGGDDFRLKINLANASDPEAGESQARCPANTCLGQSLSFGATDYVLCGN